MSQRPDPAKLNGVDPFATARGVRDTLLEGMSRSMIQFVNTDTYAQMTGAFLDTYLTITAPYRQLVFTMMTQTLAMLNMPNRTEVANLGDRLTNIEMRLDDLDSRFDTVERLLRTPQATPTIPAVASPVVQRPTATVVVGSKRLIDINGIGKVYEQKLMKGGVTSLAQLADANPEQLREIIAPTRFQEVNFDSWIEQAKQFVADETAGTTNGVVHALEERQ
jgi:predicted flap endonuclease-1-like 5' DNA nuclease